MDKKVKELLLRDLSARLPCRVKVSLIHEEKGELTGVLDAVYPTEDRVIVDELSKAIAPVNVRVGGFSVTDNHVKPYLRPMSSMTEEEKLHMELKFHFSYSDGALNNVHMFETGGTYDRDGNYEPPITYREIREVNMDLILEFIHWLNKKMFDYRKDDEGKTMIEKGLALEAPEGMYNV